MGGSEALSYGLARGPLTCTRRPQHHLWDRFARCPINQMPSESQGLKKKRSKLLLRVFVCLGLKRAEFFFGSLTFRWHLINWTSGNPVPQMMLWSARAYIDSA